MLRAPETVRDRPAAILFDLDGTLVDSAPALLRGLNEFALRRGGNPVAEKDVRRWISLGGSEMIKGALGPKVGDPQADLDEFRAILRAQKGDTSDLYPGVVAVLQALRRAGHKIALCTNKREDIAIPLIADIGISPLIDAVAGGANGHRLKPDRFLVDLALERLGYSGTDVVFVGDSEVDAETASGAGLPFVLVSFGYPVGDIDAIACAARIDDFSELPRRIDEILLGDFPSSSKAKA
jgi:phosphoglycolate phosphatase